MQIALNSRNTVMTEYWEGKAKVAQSEADKCQMNSIQIKLKSNQTQDNQLGICYNLILDLHGLTKDEALVAIQLFLTEKHTDLERMKRYDPQAFLELIIITGRGVHSRGKAVLKPSVKHFLNKTGIAFGELSGGGAFRFFID
jgi:hypothetical protein